MFKDNYMNIFFIIIFITVIMVLHSLLVLKGTLCNYPLRILNKPCTTKGQYFTRWYVEMFDFFFFLAQDHFLYHPFPGKMCL